MENKTLKTILTVLMVVFIVFCVFTEIVLLAGRPQTIENEASAVSNIISPILFLFINAVIIAYACGGYKIPHGNALKVTFMLFAVLIGVYVMTFEFITNMELPVISKMYYLVSILHVAFIGGRLNKYRINRVAVFIFVAFMLAAGIIAKISFNSFVVSDVQSSLPGALLPLYNFCSDFNIIAVPAIQLFVIGIAYVMYFKEHKEAGEKEETAAL